MSMQVADKWYETQKISNGVTLIYEAHVAPWLRCNIWHVQGRDRDLIIDTGMGLRPLTEAVTRLAERPVTAVVTHSHFDHAGGLYQFDQRCGHCAEAAILAAPNPANTVADSGFIRAETFAALPFAGFDYREWRMQSAPLTGLLDEGDVVDLGDRAFQVMHLPGHSPGSIALYDADDQTLFSGDVIYDGELLDNLYHSDVEVYRHSLKRLKELPVRAVHGGHYTSFGAGRMGELIDEYLSGARRISDPTDWINGQI
jgi:glyoxylase-like metal-dependent hydrolase (beta-lactamase superfamily II)